MEKFIGSTIGLEANRGNVLGKMVKVEYTRKADGSVRLEAVSGHNLAKMNGNAVVTAEQFADRPQDAYDSVKEARWALNKCGWSLMSEQ